MRPDTIPRYLIEQVRICPCALSDGGVQPPAFGCHIWDTTTGETVDYLESESLSENRLKAVARLRELMAPLTPPEVPGV